MSATSFSEEAWALADRAISKIAISPDYPEEARWLDTIKIAYAFEDLVQKRIKQAFPDTGDDSLYNVRRLRGQLAAIKADLEVARDAESPGDMLDGINAALAVLAS